MGTFRTRSVRISGPRALFLAFLISLLTVALFTLPAPAAAGASLFLPVLS